MPKSKKYRCELYRAVARIPYGRVVSYGMLGGVMVPPLSGRIVGRAMHFCPEDLPWWRVVARDGCLSIAKRSPLYAFEQRRRLETEGVRFVGDCVPMDMYALSAEEVDALLAEPVGQE